MNLLQFSQIPRYKLVRQSAENGWGRPTIYTDLRAHDSGEWMLVSDVRNLVVGDRPPPDVAALVEALTTIRAMLPAKIDKQAFVVNGGPPLRADDDDEFYSAKKVNALVNAIVSTADGALAAAM